MLKLLTTYYLVLLAKYFGLNLRILFRTVLLFGCSSVLTVVNKGKEKFLAGYLNSCNSLSNIFSYVAANELNELQCHVM